MRLKIESPQGRKSLRPDNKSGAGQFNPQSSLLTTTEQRLSAKVHFDVSPAPKINHLSEACRVQPTGLVD